MENNDINEIVKSVGRKYVQRRIEIEDSFKWELQTTENINRLDSQISECEVQFRVEIRNSKIDHILNSTKP